VGGLAADAFIAGEGTSIVGGLAGMAPKREEVFEKVRAVLTDALGVEEDEVTPNATLQRDLGAESIDFLDIVFRLEKEFAIKINRGELFPNDDLMNSPEFVESGRMTPAGLVKLRSALPHVDFRKFESDPRVSEMPTLFTVNTIVNYVENKLKAA
jgi:acyl carrier protein